MKTKNKMIASLEIVIVLCSVLLVAIPAIAAEQTTQAITTASEDDFVLDVYGNANEDDTIDMRDLTYVKLIFFGKKPETELADAKYDGKINPLDFIQIKLIIVGKEKELTYVDIGGEAETVRKPIKRIVCIGPYDPEELRVLDAEDKIVAISQTIADRSGYYPKISKLPLVAGSWTKPDYEAILSQNPDAVMTCIVSAGHWAGKKNEWKEKLPGVQIIHLGFITPLAGEFKGIGGVGEHDSIVGNMRKLGYILDKEEEAEEFCDWYEGWLNTITERTAKLSENEKPKVYFEWYRDYTTYRGVYYQIATVAGGHDISGDLDLATRSSTVDPEWVIEQNPAIILKCYWFYGYGTDDPSKMKIVRENIMNRPELANVDAVENGRVHVVSTPCVMDNLPSIVGVAYCAKWFHPDLFEDLNPKAIHQEFLTRFQGLDIDLDKKGVFVYPEPS